MSRLFIAVWPSEEVVEHLMSLHRKPQRGVRFVQPENWHITLRFLGESDIDEVLAALSDAVLPPSVAHLGPAVDVLAERALVVPVAGLEALASEVTVHTRRIGEPAAKRFVGHLTLARITPKVAMPPVLGALVTATFGVAEVALVRSRLEAPHARYETLETWPLRANSG